MRRRIVAAIAAGFAGLALGVLPATGASASTPTGGGGDHCYGGWGWGHGYCDDYYYDGPRGYAGYYDRHYDGPRGYGGYYDRYYDGYRHAYPSNVVVIVR
ncbi:hypothetical protein [Streptomyces sp. NPDC000410]|uniref:hypothetical protein n=1 Tax=Streptomyces sp. NPDC000410 TaxID=3154254 RepID=UPI00331AA18D